jgi:hypothetical protein
MCLTSKACNSLAKGLLCKNICLNVTDSYVVDHFLRSMDLGARANLDKTRNLTLMHCEPPPEAWELQDGRTRPEFSGMWEERVRDNSRAIVRQFPPNKLHSFR